MLGRSVEKNAPSSGGTVVSRRAVGVMAAFLFVAALAALPFAASAQGVDLGLEYATATGLGTTDIRTTVATIIRIFLGLLGVVAVVIILYAGFLWMTAGGNEERVSTAKKWLVNGVIGLIIILSAFAITQFIFGAALSGQGGFGGPGGPNSVLMQQFSQGNGTSALGSGIIDYHYPEAGQTDVPRNTKIAITLKKPFVLSTVFANYVDGFPDPTPTVSDDYVCSDGASSGTPPDQRTTCVKVDGMTPEQQAAQLQLNLLNVKIIPNENLAPPTGGSADEQFDQRYAQQETFLTGVPRASVTPVVDLGEEGQTLVFKPSAPGIGSSTEDTNYRVALRGGETGIGVWSVDPETDEAYVDLAFGDMSADGSYFWPFTVGTTLDLTPPAVRNVVPGSARALSQTERLFRNQLLQIYFDEAVDPTSASGTIPGFTKIVIEARCQSGAVDCDSAYGTDWSIVPGEVKLFNRYRTAEFMPSTECDGVAENSCGEKVYCLPRNVELRVVVNPASVGNEPPASSADNGVVDMVGNSLDGNLNGSAEGPITPERPDAYSINDHRFSPAPADELADMSDAAVVAYTVGDRLDLEPPRVVGIVPNSGVDACPSDTPEEQREALCPTLSTPYQAGPSNFPSTEPIIVEWNKTISVGSIRTGGYKETEGFLDPESTVVIRAYECRKASTELCEPQGVCPCVEDLDMPSFIVSSDLVSDSPQSEQRSRLSIIHRPFFTGNDLGYTIEELEDYPGNIPVYEPIVRAQIRDTRQNCFWPSEGFGCSGVENTIGGRTFCCDREAMDSFLCNPVGR